MVHDRPFSQNASCSAKERSGSRSASTATALVGVGLWDRCDLQAVHSSGEAIAAIYNLCQSILHTVIYIQNCDWFFLNMNKWSIMNYYMTNYSRLTLNGLNGCLSHVISWKIATVACLSVYQHHHRTCWRFHSKSKPVFEKHESESKTHLGVVDLQLAIACQNWDIQKQQQGVFLHDLCR